MLSYLILSKNVSRISISTVAYSFMFVHLQSLPSSVLLELLEQIIAKLTTKAIYKKKKKKKSTFVAASGSFRGEHSYTLQR